MPHLEEEPTFDLLLSAAQVGQWDYVDAYIGMFANTDSALTWTTAGLVNVNKAVRDMAASLWEKSDRPFLPGVARKLAELIVGDPDCYVRFRAAFALFRRGDRTKYVCQRLKEATVDPQVSAIARQYLSED